MPDLGAPLRLAIFRRARGHPAPSRPAVQRVGFYNATTNELHTASREGSLNAAFVIDTLGAWTATRTRPTMLELDNARIHHAAAFQARIPAWQQQDVYIFYLPT